MKKQVIENTDMFEFLEKEKKRSPGAKKNRPVSFNMPATEYRDFLNFAGELGFKQGEALRLAIKFFMLNFKIKGN